METVAAHTAVVFPSLGGREAMFAKSVGLGSYSKRIILEVQL